MCSISIICIKMLPFSANSRNKSFLRIWQFQIPLKQLCLRIKHVCSIDIPPTQKCRPNFSAILVQQTEIPPKPKLLSFHAGTVIDIPPKDPRSHATMPSLPTSLPQARHTSPSLAPTPPWSSPQNCLPSH